VLKILNPPDAPTVHPAGPQAPAVELRVAFAGHNRPADLGDAKAVAKSLDKAFQLVAAAGVRRALLLSGLAPGSDQLAAAAWRRAQLGPVHAVEPFLPVGEPDIVYRQLVDDVTFLDGEAARRRNRNPYLAQTRWLLSRAELLVVVWNGAAPRGPGGTADAVRIALDAGIPILWIRPGSETIRLICGLQPLRADFDEFLEALAQPDGEPPPADPLRLARALEQTAAPQPEPERIPLASSALDEWLHKRLWRTFAVFQRWLGGAARSGGATPDPPQDLMAQAGFQALSAAYDEADRRAVRLAEVHRSEQILLLLAAVIAAVIGSAPAVWPELKVPAVGAELVLAFVALVVWTSAQRTNRHERWTQTRRLAEQIRLERAGWALGFSPCNLGSPSMRQEHRSLVSPLLRRTPPPVGRLDDARMTRWAEWGLAQLVADQADYHRGSTQLNARIAHRLHLAEDLSFRVLLTVLAVFAAASIVGPVFSFHPPHWAGGLVLMTSVIVPAIGAATMALEAKLEFADRAERSARLSARLTELAQQVGGGGRHEIEAAAHEAFECLIAEADQWREAATRRRLVRGG
jgi:hypothetical protein